MPGGASKLCDVRRLADTRAVIELDLPVADLPGLPTELFSGVGSVHARLRFGREQARAAVQVELDGQLDMTCQRCMGSMNIPVRARSTVLLAETEGEADGVPPDAEVYLAPEGRLNPAALVAEELLLALPIVPLHEPGAAQCVSVELRETAEAAAPAPTDAAPEATPQAPAGETTRPFADLRALLAGAGRGRKDERQDD